MLVKILLTLFCVQMAVSKLISDSSISPVILYGMPARIEDFPFFAGLEYCGASILSKRWLITAAHCVDQPSVIANRYVYVGGERENNSVVLKYDKIVIHPQYINIPDEIIVNDIALLRLQTPLKFSQKVKTVKLPTTQMAGNQGLVLIGRGMDETNKSSESLLKMDVTQLSARQCIRSSNMHKKPVTQKTLICGKRSYGRGGMCFGDSGSPLLHGDTIVGLASFIVRDCTKVGFYTNVATYVPWIRSVIRSK